jgi:hypothetical protein
LKRKIYLACFVVHFVLILLVGSRRAFSILSKGGTLLPSAWSPVLKRGEVITTDALAQNLDASNVLQQAAAAYIRCAGIEIGYGFFAPKVATTRKLVFELSYPDGRLEYELPRVGNESTGLRLTLLFENLSRIQYEPLRQTIFKMMAFAVWQEHPDAERIRTVFGFVVAPRLADVEQGKKESYQVLYAYDFRFNNSDEPH